MQFQNFAFLGVAAGAIFACWNSVKDILLKFIGLFIQTVDLVGEDNASSFVGYMVEHYKYSKVFKKVFENDHLYLNKFKKYGYITYLNMKKTDMIFFNGIWPILFKVHDEKSSVNDDNKPKLNVTGHVYFIRNTFNIEKVLGEAIQKTNEKTWYYSIVNQLKRFAIHYIPNKENSVLSAGNNSLPCLGSYCKLLNHQLEDLGFVHEKKDQLKTLFFPKEIDNKVELARKWLSSQEWFLKRNINWKNGWLLYGAPGTGKSALARAIAVDLDLPMYVYRLSELTAQQFTDNWRKMQSSSPCVALFEDFDSCFDGRKNITGIKDVLKPHMGLSKDGATNDRIETELTFDTFLNSIDGVERYNGLFIIITTNDLSKIDDALKLRPGRIDKVIELGYMSYECKLEMAQAILGDNKELYDEIVEYVENNRDENLTGAQFQEKLVSKALTEFMKD